MYSPAQPEVVADRLGALRAGGPGAIERLLVRVPALAEALLGRGPLVDSFLRPTSKTVDSLTRLGTLLSSQATIALIIGHADRIETQLLALTRWHGGLVSREVALAESGADPEVLDRAAAGLADLMLSDPAVGYVAIREGVMDHIYLPARLFREHVHGVNSATLQILLDNLDIASGSTKAARVDAIEMALRDGDVVRRALDLAGLDAVNLFDRVCAAPGHIAAFSPMHSTRDYLSERNTLTALTSLGLLGYDRVGGVMWVWLDVLVALWGSLFPSWPAPSPNITPQPDDHRVPSMPGVVSTLDRLIAQYGAAPVVALKSGGIGVQAIRSTAKALRLPPATVGLLTVLSVELGLVSSVVKSDKGRGRNRTIEEEWRPTTAISDWKSQSAARRWARLVAAWLDSRQLAVDGKPVERYEFSPWDRSPTVARGLFARTLAELEGGSVERVDFAEWLTYRYPMLHDPGTAAQLLTEATALGLIEDTDVVMLTPAARMLLTGGDIEEVLSGGPTTFVVQADHTIIAPPDLAGDVASMLETFSHLESATGARIYRIDDRGVTSAIDGGVDAAEIVAFLTEHSPTGLPQNVERTIVDTAARHGKLQVGSAATWIAADDPALISAALAVKAAKLVALSPTSAVSSLPRTRVMAALRGAGLAALDTEATETQPAAWARPRPLPEDRTRRIELFPTDLAGLAAGLADTTELTYEVDWDSAFDRLTEDL